MSAHSRPPVDPRRGRPSAETRRARLEGIADKVLLPSRLQVVAQIDQALKAGDHKQAFKMANRLFRAVPLSERNYAMVGEHALHVFALLPAGTRFRAMLQRQLHDLAVHFVNMEPMHARTIFEVLGAHSANERYKRKCYTGVERSIETAQRAGLLPVGVDPHLLILTSYRKIAAGNTPAARIFMAREGRRFFDVALEAIKSGEPSDYAAVLSLWRNHRDAFTGAHQAALRARFHKVFGKALPA